jgi:hypothetical protein
MRPGLVLLDLLLGEEDGCDACVVSLEIVLHDVLFAFRAARSAMQKGAPIGHDRGVGAHFIEPRFIAFVAHLLAVEIIL